MDRHMQYEYDRMTDREDRLDQAWEDNAYAVRESIREGTLTIKRSRNSPPEPFESAVFEFFDEGEVNALVQHIVRGEGDQALALVRKAVGKELEVLYTMTFAEVDHA